MLGLTSELKLTYKPKTTIYKNTQVNVIQGIQIL